MTPLTSAKCKVGVRIQNEGTRQWATVSKAAFAIRNGEFEFRFKYDSESECRHYVAYDPSHDWRIER